MQSGAKKCFGERCAREASKIPNTGLERDDADLRCEQVFEARETISIMSIGRT